MTIVSGNNNDFVNVQALKNVLLGVMSHIHIGICI